MAEVTAVELVEAQQLLLGRMTKRMTARQRRIIRAALMEFADKLGSLRGGAWNEARRLATMRMLVEGLSQMVGAQSLALTADLKALVRVSQLSAVNYLSTLDKHFLGVARPLRFDTLEWWEDTNKNIGKTRIRTYHKSLERYGVGAARQIEDALGKRILVGEPWHAARAEVWAATREVVGKRQWMVDRIIRTECLLPDTLVSGAVVRAASRRSYEGTVIEIVTERGRKLTTTPNHPMLTRRGWIGTGELGEGDDLVCYTGKQNASATGHQYVATPPATISEIFDSIAAVGVCERRAGAKPDFHGDGRDGNVDVSHPTGELGLGHFASISEPLAKHCFAPTNGTSGASFCSRCRGLISTEGLCLCRRSQGYAAALEPAFDGAIAYATKFLAESVHAFAGLVSCANLVNGQVGSCFGVGKKPEFVFGRVGCGSRFESARFHFSDDRSTRDSGDFLDAPSAIAADVELDRVVKLSWREYAGHVYNLSTSHGYFAINGALTGNSSAAWNGTQLAALQSEDDPDDDDGDRMLKKLVAHFDNVTGRDSVLLHGQTRPVDKPFFDSFHGVTYMAPPNRPNDREVIVGWRKSYGDVFDDYDRETATGYDPEVHGKRKALKGAEDDPGDSDVSVPMKATRRRLKRKPTFTKPDKKRRDQQISSLREQRRALVERLRRARSQSAHYRRIIAGSPGTAGLARQSLNTSGEMVKSLSGQVEQMGFWIDDLVGQRRG